MVRRIAISSHFFKEGDHNSRRSEPEAADDFSDCCGIFRIVIFFWVFAQ
jgi:hypothetical protein